MKPKKVLLYIETSMSYGRDILHGISHYVSEGANWLTTMDERGIVDRPPYWLRNWSGDGIISRTANPRTLKILEQLSCLQVEVLGNGQDRPAEVLEDEMEIARLALDHFRERGLKNFAFYAYGNCWWINYRVDNYVRLLKDYGITCHVLAEKTTQRAHLHPVWDERYEVPLIEWLRKLPKPIGMMTLYDYQSSLVINACRKAGIGVPEEVAVLGTSNDEHLCNLFTPSISSIDPNAVLIGYEAARLLDIKMSGKRRFPVPKPSDYPITGDSGQNRRLYSSNFYRTPIIVKPKGVVARRSTDILAIEDADVVAALKFIRGNVFHGITVADVVHETALSQSTLQRRFKQIYGRTPEQEMIRLRMERARELLSQTTHSVESVAEMAGFSSRDYFVKAFRKNVGQTPLAWRRNQHESSPLF